MVLFTGRFTASGAVCVSMYSGDGDCDENNNNEECGGSNEDDF